VPPNGTVAALLGCGELFHPRELPSIGV
jgi:hypothetical protein